MNSGLSRVDAEDAVFERIQSIRSRNLLSPKFGNNWFEAIASKTELRPSYTQKHLSMKRIRELIEDPTTKVPPVPDDFPRVRHLGYPIKSS